MARGEDPASASTSFFIVTARVPALDGKYTAFGRVVDGMSVVEAIEQVPSDGEAPTTRVELMRVRVVEAEAEKPEEHRVPFVFLLLTIASEPFWLLASDGRQVPNSDHPSPESRTTPSPSP